MSKPLKRPGYGWLLKWILAAILLAVGFTMFFKNDFVYLVTGGVIVIFSLFRVWALVKTLRTEAQRTLNIIEIVLSAILGVILIIGGVQSIRGEGDLKGIWEYLYKYSLVFIFSFRAIVFFYSTTFLDEKTEQIKFWTHILLLPLATFLGTHDKFGAEWVAWLLLVISILGGVYLIYDGTKGYGGYREYQRILNEDKVEKEKETKAEKEIEEIDHIIPETEEEDRPYVN